MKLEFIPPTNPNQFNIYLETELMGKIWFGFITQQWEMIEMKHKLTRDQLQEIVRFMDSL